MNKLKEAIEKKGSAIGTFLGVTNCPIIECMGYTGMDFLVIDTEHGPYDTMPMSDLIHAASTSGLSPIVRVGDVTHKEIQRAVDNGAEGIIVPCLESVEEFKKVVDLAKYAPIGNRGFIKGRGSGFGNADWADVPLPEYMKNANERVLVLPQCETKEALDNIEEIVTLEGLDGIFIGPFDLSIALGIPGEFEHPDFKAAIERIIKVCHDAGKICLIFAMSIEDSRMYLEQGMDAVAYSIDSIMITNAYKNAVNAIRQ